MPNLKRLTISTACGLLFGFVCFGLASGGSLQLPWPAGVQIISSRLLIGFAIGISSISLGHWSIHGLVMGMLFSVPLAFSGLMAPDNPDFSKIGMFAVTVILGMVYGFLIELITTVLFKAQMTVERQNQRLSTDA